MTTNNDILEDAVQEEQERKEGLQIIEEDAFENEVSEEELLEFYKENKDTVDLIGGMGMIESLLNLPDEQFNETKDEFIQLFQDSVNELATEQELRAIIFTQGYTSEDLNEEFEEAKKRIDSIDFLSQPKKDFLNTIIIITNNKVQDIIDDTKKIIHLPCELEENVQMPAYAHETDAGLDIYAREEITINPGETQIIKTGIKVAVPEGYALLIQPRSGQSAKTKLRIANTPGLIDAGYRDEIGVIVENIEPPLKDIEYEFDNKGEIHIKSIEHGKPYTIVEGQRFAQMRLVQVPKANFVKVESVGEIGEDRGGGFGSTGIG